MTEAVYVGFGSVWFVDFDTAHRDLGVETMLSLERDEIVAKRANFNKPYRTIEVIQGNSFDLLPSLVERDDLKNRPWITWLDYDDILDETKLAELTDLVGELPDDSVLITTFSAAPSRYANPVELSARFEELFGDAFPWEDFDSNRKLKNEVLLMPALSQTVLALLQAHFVSVGREGAALPAFAVQYQDGTPMATAGCILSAAKNEPAVRSLVASESWSGVVSRPIVTPPLTQKEVSALRSLLPSANAPTRADVQQMGFDLDEDDIQSFAEHYLYYPHFVQAVR